MKAAKVGVGRDRRRLPRRRAKPRAGATSTTSKLGKENSVEEKKKGEEENIRNERGNYNSRQDGTVTIVARCGK